MKWMMFIKHLQTLPLPEAGRAIQGLGFEGVDLTVRPNGSVEPDRVKVRVIPLRGGGYEIKPWSAEGDHGGGDRLMLEDIFSLSPPSDKYLRAADERAGACSILVGIAANRSLETGAKVKVADLVEHLPTPDYSPMPTRQQTVPMPLRRA